MLNSLLRTEVCAFSLHVVTCIWLSDFLNLASFLKLSHISSVSLLRLLEECCQLCEGRRLCAQENNMFPCYCWLEFDQSKKVELSLQCTVPFIDFRLDFSLHFILTTLVFINASGVTLRLNLKFPIFLVFSGLYVSVMGKKG